jgi:hypothetical protein
MGWRLGRWRWRRLLLIPALASVHACDCGGCFSDSSQGCRPGPISCGQGNNCAIGGQCALEGGTCTGNLQLDTTTTCDDAGTFCCNPLPSCDQLGGACQQRVPGLGSPCSDGELQGDCGDTAIACCVVVPGEDGSSDAPEVALDAPSVGSCNGAPCASGCTCESSASEAGGGACQCPAEDASSDAESDASLETGADGESDAWSDADAGASGQAFDASGDAEAGESAARDMDGSIDASVPSDATAVGEAGDAADLDAARDADAAEVDAEAGNPCGVIICGAGCTCVSEAMSACVCP